MCRSGIEQKSRKKNKDFEDKNGDFEDRRAKKIGKCSTILRGQKIVGRGNRSEKE
nr:hypothetical protein [uncultured Sellimonas sp.]